MTWRILIAIGAAGLAGCDTTDPQMGLTTAHNSAAQRSAALSPDSSIEGGSAVRGVGAQQRYLTGNVRQPAGPTAEPAAVAPDAASPPVPR